MAVQIPDPGTGNGQTGDNEYVFRKKVKDNFSDQTNAASRVIGTTTGKVPLADNVIKAMYGGEFVTRIVATTPKSDANSLEAGTVILLDGNLDTFLNQPPISFPAVATVKLYGNSGYQTAWSYYNEKEVWYRSFRNGVFSAWIPMSQTASTYTATTAAGANVVVSTDGKLMRSTSSERYKDILAPLELDDARYQDAMALKPIVYRSTADADNPAYHYYSFSAEELGAYDPAFTLWRETETVTDKDGNVTEQPLAERQAEGININALLAMSHAIAIKQDKIIKALEARIEILEAK